MRCRRVGVSACLLLFCCAPARASQPGQAGFTRPQTLWLLQKSAPDKGIVTRTWIGPGSTPFYVAPDEPSGAVFNDDAPPRSAVDIRSPVYPKAYAAGARSGKVCINCALNAARCLPDGHVLQVGGVAFGQSSLAWLEQPGLHFSPMMLNGKAVAGRHSFILKFEPPS